MNKQIIKLLFTVFLGLAMLGNLGGVYAQDNAQATAWILVGDSPLLDRSSKYLFKGKYEGGIKYAKKALARSQSEYTQVIGQHNLCIAYQATGKAALAENHCRNAAGLSIPAAALKQLKPGLYKLSRKRVNQDMPTLDKLIARNLQLNIHEGNTQKLAKAD